MVSLMETRPAPKTRILLVDDDASILSALMRQLRHKYEVAVATSGMDGLRAIADGGQFAVIVSDMRMPRMDGATFLSRVRQAAPDATRMLLTGTADVETTSDAVNRGNLFRLLFKPCPPDTLQEALEAAVAQHNLVVAERELLEQTLQGSVRALVEALSLASPAAFGKTQRVKRLVLEMERRCGPKRSWAIELAATVAQLGAMSVPVAVVEQAYLGEPLTDDEAAMLQRVPEVTEHLLAGIPRLDPVREILRLQSQSFEAPKPGAGPPQKDGPRGDQLPLGARLLRIASDYDELEAQGLHAQLAVSAMRARAGAYDPALLERLAEAIGINGDGAPGPELREVGVSNLKAGMVLAADLKSMKGVLLLARGTEITEPVLRWFANRRSDLRLPIRVVLPALERTEAAAEAAVESADSDARPHSVAHAG